MRRWPAVCIALSLVACATTAPPCAPVVSSPAFDHAQAALDGARAAGAVVWAPRPLYRARVSLERARLLADEGDAAGARDALALAVQQAHSALQLSVAKQGGALSNPSGTGLMP